MKTKITLLLFSLMVVCVQAAPFDIFSTFFSTPPANTPCGVWRNAEANYLKTAANGWGWKRDTGTVHTASVATNAVVEFVGNQGHSGCAIGSVNVTGGATEKFRFTVYWPSADGPFPTNSYPLTLTGFLP